MIYVFYHCADLDGFMSGLQLKFVFEHLRKKVITVPFNYEKEAFIFDRKLEDVVESGDIIVFTDVFYSIENKLKETYEYYEKLHNKGVKIKVIDHHGTTINLIKQIPFIDSSSSTVELKDKNNLNQNGYKVSAAYLVLMEYKQLLSQNEEFINLISDYDVFNWDDKERWEDRILPFQFGIRGHHDIINMKRIEENKIYKDMIKNNGKIMIEVESVINDGKAILRYIHNRNKIVGEKMVFGECKLYNREYDENNNEEPLYKFEKCAIVSDYCNSSMIFEDKLGVEYSDYNLLILCRPDIEKPNFTSISIISPRSDLIDASELCKVFGGGGHKGIGGCFVDLKIKSNGDKKEILLYKAK